MESNYWAMVARKRLSRRRAISIVGGTTLGATFLVACSGEDEPEAQSTSPTSPTSSTGSTVGSTPTAADTPVSTGTSSLISTPVDTSAQAKRGGVGKMIMRFEPSSWEPHSRPGRWFSEIFPLAFQRMVALKEGVTTPPGGEIVGDAAESFEFSDDNLTLTFKLRKGASFHNIAPVNGRPIDAQDVVYSWNRFMEKGGQTSNFMNSANPEAPVLSVEAPDSETVVLKLAFPAATLLASLTNDRGAAWVGGTQGGRKRLRPTPDPHRFRSLLPFRACAFIASTIHAIARIHRPTRRGPTIHRDLGIPNSD